MHKETTDMNIQPLDLGLEYAVAALGCFFFEGRHRRHRATLLVVVISAVSPSCLEEA